MDCAREVAEELQDSVFQILVQGFEDRKGSKFTEPAARGGPSFHELDQLSWNIVLGVVIGFFTNIVSAKLLEHFSRKAAHNDLIGRTEAVELITQILQDGGNLSHSLSAQQREVVRLVVYSRLRQHEWNDSAAARHSDIITNGLWMILKGRSFSGKMEGTEEMDPDLSDE